MLRSAFFSAGLFVTLWGVSCLFVDKIVLSDREELPRDSSFRGLFTTNAERQKVLDPPDWAAFSMLSVGTVTMLYSFALPKKQA